jgi:hypothetical protein
MRLLHPGDQRGIAWQYARQGVLFAALPDKASTLARDEFPGAVALFLGLPDPLILEFLATKGPGDFHFEDKNALLRRLDVYGNNLSLYMEKGHGRTWDARASTTRFNGRWLAWRELWATLSRKPQRICSYRRSIRCLGTPTYRKSGRIKKWGLSAGAWCRIYLI